MSTFSGQILKVVFIEIGAVRSVANAEEKTVFSIDIIVLPGVTARPCFQSIAFRRLDTFLLSEQTR